MLEKIDLIINYDRISEKEKKDFFYDLASIALKYLQENYKSQCYRYLSTETTLEDYAIESISPLFLQYGSTNQIYLQYQLEKWRTPITKKEQATFFIYKVVSYNVENLLVKKFKEADPFFEKIYSNLKFTINKKGYFKTCLFGTCYIVKDIYHSPNKKLINVEDFSSLPEYLFIENVEVVIDNLFNYLGTQTNFEMAIPVNLLVRRIKHVYELQYSIDTPNHTNLHINDSINISSIIDKAFEFVQEKVDSIYLRKSRISFEESIHLKNVLAEISHALGNGGISRGLYFYTEKEFPNISKSEFHNKYHPILDYLIRILKKEITKSL